MFRLLYLLILQRLRRPGAPPRKAVGLAIGGVVLCASVAWLALVPPHFAVPSFNAGAGKAAVQVQVDSKEPPPVVIFLEALGIPDAQGAATQAKSARLISVGNSFKPMFQVAALASEIEVGNDDALPHNTHVFKGDRTLFNVATPLPGVRVRKLLSRAGLFDVRCDLHPWMRAWILVPPGPHYAVLWQPARVAIEDIPPGRYRLHFWEPARGETVRPLTLAAGETKSLSWPER
jgi:hypothetical protein